MTIFFNISAFTHKKTLYNTIHQTGISNNLLFFEPAWPTVTTHTYTICWSGAKNRLFPAKTQWTLHFKILKNTNYIVIIYIDILILLSYNVWKYDHFKPRDPKLLLKAFLKFLAFYGLQECSPCWGWLASIFWTRNSFVLYLLLLDSIIFSNILIYIFSKKLQIDHCVMLEWTSYNFGKLRKYLLPLLHILCT